MSKILQILQGEKISPPPIWLMRQAGRYLNDYRTVRSTVNNFLDLCYNPNKACDVTMQPIDMFDFDAAILFSDILVLPHALHFNVDFIDGKGPVVNGFHDDMINRICDIDIHHHLQPVYDTVTKIRQKLPKHKALFGFAGAPWTIATYIIEGGSSRDFRNVNIYARTKPDKFLKLCYYLAEKTAEYLTTQVKYGADALMIFDSWAGVIGDDIFDDICIEPHNVIINHIRKIYPDIPIIAFPKSIGTRIGRFVEKTAIKAISIDHTQSLDYIRHHLDKNITIQGNLDPFLLYQGGDAMYRQIDIIREKLSDYPHIFNLGHGVDRQTNPQHVLDLVNYIRQ